MRRCWKLWIPFKSLVQSESTFGKPINPLTRSGIIFPYIWVHAHRYSVRVSVQMFRYMSVYSKRLLQILTFSQKFFFVLRWWAEVTKRSGRSESTDSPSWTNTGIDRFLSEIRRYQQSISNKAKWQGNFLDSLGRNIAFMVYDRYLVNAVMLGIIYLLSDVIIIIANILNVHKVTQQLIKSWSYLCSLSSCTILLNMNWWFVPKAINLIKMRHIG